jgi:deazaflavin-dependent oxidoreductase (nitroreductase family)
MANSQPSFVRRRPGPFLRAFLKAPVALYHGPLADLLRSRCVMLLTTQGRRSGLARTNGVSFMPVGDHFVVFSGWGVRSSWFRNLLANPEMMIKVGRRRMRATAKVVEDPARRIELMRQMQARSSSCGPPMPLRPLLKLSGAFDYDGEIKMAIEAGESLPVLEIFPHE